MRRIVGALGAMLVGLTVVLAPTATGAAERDPAAPASGIARIRIVDNAFRPRVISVTPGTRVRWTNTGANVHSSTGKVWDSGLLSPGETFSRVFRKSGTFRFHCTVHPTMTGRIVVG